MSAAMRSLAVAPSSRTVVGARRADVCCKAAPRQSFGMAMTAAAAAGLLLSASPAFASVSFNLSDKATVESPVHLEFSVKGMTVKPASEGLQPGTGHFHVLVDEPSVPEGVAIPFDKTHLHYGKGQTAADVPLEPGKHKLTLQFANALHESLGPDYASTITIDVKASTNCGMEPVPSCR